MTRVSFRFPHDRGDAPIEDVLARLSSMPDPPLRVGDERMVAFLATVGCYCPELPLVDGNGAAPDGGLQDGSLQDGGLDSGPDACGGLGQPCCDFDLCDKNLTCCRSDLSSCFPVCPTSPSP